MTCNDKTTVGHLVTHEATFKGPSTAQQCELPNGLQGQVIHTFVNSSIYPCEFSTVGRTQPSALAIVANLNPTVKLKPIKRNLLISTPTQGNATQIVEHSGSSTLPVPQTAAVDFDTTVQIPGVPSIPKAGPMLNIDLVP